MTIRQEAKIRCDRERRRKPHLKFFLGDPACSGCMEFVKKRRAEAHARKGGGGK